MIVTRDKVCRGWIDKKRNNSGERQKKKKKLGFITVKGEEGLFFALKREIKWAELRLILEGRRGNGKQEVKKGEEKMKDMHDYVLVYQISCGHCVC
jgi:hypothetical protein